MSGWPAGVTTQHELCEADIQDDSPVGNHLYGAIIGRWHLRGVEETSDVSNDALEWTTRHAKRFIRNAVIRGFVSFEVEQRAKIDHIILDDLDVANILQTTHALDTQTTDGNDFTEFCCANSAGIHQISVVKLVPHLAKRVLVDWDVSEVRVNH